MPITAQALAQLHAQSERGDVAGALDGIEAALVGDQGNATAWHLAGIIRRRAGRLESAVEAFQRAIAGGIDTAELRNSLGLALGELGRTGDAAVQFAAAIRLDPDYIPAIVNAAKAKAATGDWRGAEDDLRSALRRFPGSALARGALALILSQRGEVQGAAEQYAQLLASKPDDLSAAIRLGKALRDLGQGEAALAHFRSCQPRFAASPEYAEAMAGAMVDCGQIAEAEAVLEDAVARQPGYFAGHRALARLAREFGTGKDAYRTYRALTARWPGERSIWLDWLGLMVSYRDYSVVREVVAEAEKHLGASAPLTYFDAVARGETDDADGAERLFASLEAVTGEASGFLVARSRNALRRGELRAAQAWLERATTADPLDQFGWAYLGLAWRMLGDEREFWLHDYDVQTRQMPIAHLADPAQMEALRQALRALHSTAHHPPEQSLRGGTQTPGALFLRPEAEIVALREAIHAQVDAFAQSLPDDPAHPFYRRKTASTRFTGSWSVRLRGEGFHVVHLHQEGWISSALHLVMPPSGAGDAPDAGCLTLGQPPAELGLDLPPRKVVRPVEGSLVLFPSSMWHGTVPFAGGERMTVAFDAVPA